MAGFTFLWEAGKSSGAPSGAGRSILTRVDRRIDNAFLGGKKRNLVLCYTTTTIIPQYHRVSLRVYTRESFTYNNLHPIPIIDL